MRASLLAPIITLLGLAALPACTVNYYVPAATDAPAASNGPRRYPPRGQWQQVPGPPRQGQYPPVASAPGPAPQPGYPVSQPTGPVRQTPPPQPGPPRGPVKETPAPGPIRQTPAPAPAPAPQTYPYPTGGIKPSKPVTPAAPTAPAPAPAYPYPTGGIKPSKDIAVEATLPAPVPVPSPPTPAPTYPYPTGGIKPSKPVDEAPVLPTETLDAPAPTGKQAAPAASTIPVPGPGKIGPESEMQAGPVLVFGKTPCFGKCPHFTARLYANGRLQYEGHQYAPVEGNLDLLLDPGMVSRLLQAAEDKHFRSFKPEYASGATDMATTTLVINYPDGSTKSVRVEDGAPEELQQLLALVNSQIEKAVGAANNR
jgi:Domain of unknown function (DUF6438)